MKLWPILYTSDVVSGFTYAQWPGSPAGLGSECCLDLCALVHGCSPRLYALVPKLLPAPTLWSNSIQFHSGISTRLTEKTNLNRQFRWIVPSCYLSCCCVCWADCWLLEGCWVARSLPVPCRTPVVFVSSSLLRQQSLLCPIHMETKHGFKLHEGKTSSDNGIFGAVWKCLDWVYITLGCTLLKQHCRNNVHIFALIYINVILAHYIWTKNTISILLTGNVSTQKKTRLSSSPVRNMMLW